MVKNSDVYKNERIATIDDHPTSTVIIVLEDENGRIPIARYDALDEDLVRIRKIIAKLWEYNRIINYIKSLDD
ncbi:MAG: hypothetical protein M0R51_18100 [Clostridia bacterium]|jgi:hypothetical protein|nr:hypothetical protein [Clostridia bacterium]